MQKLHLNGLKTAHDETAKNDIGFIDSGHGQAIERHDTGTHDDIATGSTGAAAV